MYSEKSWIEFISKHIEGCLDGCLKTPFPKEFALRKDLEVHKLDDFLTSYEISPLFKEKIIEQLPPCKRCGSKLQLSSFVIVGFYNALFKFDLQKLHFVLNMYPKKVDNFMNFLEDNELRSAMNHPIAVELKEAFSAAQCVEVDGIQWFRARYIKKRKPYIDDFFEPPMDIRDKINAGRYNDPKEIHFYASNTITGAAREIIKKCKNRQENVWVQQFEFPKVPNIIKLTIFDSIIANHDIILYLIISGIIEKIPVKNYKFTRFIKFLTKQLGMNGILYSQDEFRYTNLVIFNLDFKRRPIGSPIKIVN